MGGGMQSLRGMGGNRQDGGRTAMFTDPSNHLTLRTVQIWCAHVNVTIWIAEKIKYINNLYKNVSTLSLSLSQNASKLLGPI